EHRQFRIGKVLRRTSLEPDWLSQDFTDAELTVLYRIFFGQEAVDPMIRDRKISSCQNLFLKILTKRIARETDWDSFFTAVDKFDSLGLPIFKLMSDNRAVFGVALSHLWKVLPEKPTLLQFEQIARATDLVEDPFLRLQLWSYYYQERWPQMNFQERLD